MNLVTLTRTTGRPFQLASQSRFAAAIDDKLSAVEPVEKSIFSTFDPAVSGNSVYNASLWAGGGAAFDFTGVQWIKDEGGLTTPRCTALTPRHVVMADHVEVPVGTNLTWIAADGVFVTRQLAATQNVSGDLKIGYLDADLPGTIATYRMFHKQLLGVQKFAGMPVVSVFPTGAPSYTADVRQIGSDTDIGQFAVPTDPTRALYYRNLSTGSSSPAFAAIGDELILLGALFTGGAGALPSLTNNQDALLTVVAALDVDETGYLPEYLS